MAPINDFSKTVKNPNFNPLTAFELSKLKRRSKEERRAGGEWDPQQFFKLNSILLKTQRQNQDDSSESLESESISSEDNKQSEDFSDISTININQRNNIKPSTERKMTKSVKFSAQLRIRTSKYKIDDSPDEAFHGDPVFIDILDSLNLDNCYSRAAEYYKLAYRHTKILHFNENSFTKKSYFAITHPYMRELTSML